MHPTVSRYVWTHRIFAVVYAVAALVFFFFPGEFVYLLNTAPKVFKLADGLPDPTDRFWITLAASSMVLHCLISVLASVAPSVRGYGFAHFASKMTSAAAFFYLFIHEHGFFAYLVGGSIELVFGLIVLWRLLWLSGGNAVSVTEPSVKV